MICSDNGIARKKSVAGLCSVFCFQASKKLTFIQTKMGPSLYVKKMEDFLHSHCEPNSGILKKVQNPMKRPPPSSESLKAGLFLPIFSLLCPSILDLGTCTGQTDGQTDDGHHRFMFHPTGAGHNNCNKLCGRPPQYAPAPPTPAPPSLAPPPAS